MSLAPIVQAMLESGCTAEQIAAVVAVHEAEADAVAAEEEARLEAQRVHRREMDRERQRRHRLSRTVTRDNALSRVTPLKQKEPSPPTPPLLEKLNSPIPPVTSDEVTSPSREISELVDWFETQWNSLAKTCGLGGIRAMTDKRIRAIRCRADDLVNALGFADPRAGFVDTFNRIRGSPFLRGSNNGSRAWRCDVDWLLTESNFLKVHEGKYAQENRVFDIVRPARGVEFR